MFAGEHDHRARREGSHYEAELRNGVRLPVGRTRYKELREKLG